MPRNKNNNNDENNARIKLVFFEAENVNSDLTGVINAFANAIRATPVQILTVSPPPAVTESRKNASLSLPDDSSDSTSLGNDEPNVIDGVVANSTQKTGRARKSFRGTIDETIKWDGNGVPFSDFVKQKNPQDTMKKYLVIAAWFKLHGEHDTITSNLMYNAYRKMGWIIQQDPGQTFRDGAKSDRGYFQSKGKGTYTLTNIGLDIVNGLGGLKRTADS